MTYTEKAQCYESGSFRAYSRDLERQDDEEREAERLAQEAEDEAMEEPLDERTLEDRFGEINQAYRRLNP